MTAYNNPTRHRELGIDAVVLFDRIRTAEGHQVRQTSRRGEVTVTTTEFGWRIEGKGSRQYYRPEVDGTMHVEIIECGCGVENPRAPGQTKKAHWQAKGLCDELGHVERVTAMAKKILASY